MMKALLLLAFGGPRSLDEVVPFLDRLFKGRKLTPSQLEEIKERYRLIGGRSPLPDITFKQAKVLESRLNTKGNQFQSYIGMRYSHPLIEETLREIFHEGIEDVIAIPMAPFRSRFSTGTYKAELEQSNKILGEKIKINFIEGWHSHPLFLKAVVEKVEEGLNQFPPEERKEVHLLFTAHSLPESVVGKDPYIQDMRECVKEVLKRLEPFPWHIAFQSKGGGPEKWIGPDVETVLCEMMEAGVREVLLIPIGFVSDHIEILYDIDILYKEKAESLGMSLKRTPSLNDSVQFIEALATIVEERMNKRVQG